MDKDRARAAHPRQRHRHDAEELDQNLGVIAKSGSLKFKSENEKSEDIDIIGQFGVGFYSAFMVSDHVRVESKAYGADEAFAWESDGADGYTIRACEKAGHGTEITLHVKADTEDEKYSEFLDTYRLRGLVKKYSDYIRYPIRMEVEKTRPKEGAENEYEHYFEVETLNSMVPLWKKNKNEGHGRGVQQLLQGEVLRLAGPAQGDPHGGRGHRDLQRAAVHPGQGADGLLLPRL